jgi:hypothetical protein
MTSGSFSAAVPAAARPHASIRVQRELGHRATLRPKALEADYLAAVRGLIQDSGLLARNDAAPAQTDHLVGAGSSAIGSGATRRGREGGLRALAAMEPMSAQRMI